MAFNEISATTLYSSKGSLWNTLLSKILGLPLLELVAICTNLVVLVLFLLREVFFCVGGRVWFFKDNDNNVGVVGNGETFDVRIGTWFKLSVLSCLYVLLVQVLVLGFDGVALIKEDFVVVDLSLLSVPVLQCLVWIVLSFTALRCKYKVYQKFPILLRVSWFVLFVVCLCGLYVDGRGFWVEGSKHMRSHVLANFAATPALAFLCIVAIRGVSGIQVCRNAENQQPLLLDEDDDEEPGCLKVTPYSDAGLFSLATLSWLNSILSIGAKRPLELKDIPLVAPKDRAKTNFKILNSNWEKLKAEKSPTQPSLAWTLLKSFWKEAAINAIFAGVTTLVSYVGPYMISYFVDYLSGIETFPHEGYVLAGIFFVAKLVETFTTRQWYLGVDIMGMHVRSALTAMVYQKGLRLSSLARQSHTSGEIVNYMAIDVQRVGDYAWYLHDMWMLPLQIVLALAILYKNVGIAAVATLVATIISIVITIPVARIQEDYQDKLMAAKDERMRKTSECLRNMRILKLQAWEDRYRIKLEEMRGVEFKWLKKALYSQAFITFMFWSSPIFVSAVTFATSILLGGKLTAGGVLSALATFRILQEPLRNFPDLVSTMAQTKVSLDRLSCFLLEEELQEDATTVLPQGVSNIAIEIKESEFSWDPSSSRPTLSEINMKVEKGMRVAVCGTVGSGKSSFLSCILGEIPKLSGEVSVCGSAAYVSQSAWIQSGTIEENILFGSPKDKPKYKNVIHACSLKKDLELFSHGDQTIIGDRGINLSGGQKQRVQLARALYQDADIYLLDDPFSAVDAHTGSELFREYILTALANKTVIFVTHQVEFLPAADLILVLKEGCIIQAGKYDDLLQAGTDFKALVSAHHEAIEAMDIPSHSSEDSDENLSLEASVMTSKKSICSANDIDSLTKEMQDGPSASDPKANKEKKKAKRSRKKQLVQEEERVRGRVSMKVYLSYMAAAYKGLLIPLIIIAQALFQFLQIASNWWMAWANPQTEGDQPKVKPMILLLVYMALAFGSSLFIFVRAVLVATFGLAAAQKLFLKMLRCVFNAPMYFFDSTPAGRILNRVSVDQSVVDLDIPFRLGGFAATTIQLIGIVGVMTEVTWQVLLLVIPMAIACLWMQKYYMASSRELVRIVSIQKLPIINLFGESIAGASTIRGFGQEKRFMKRNLYLLDCFARPFFCSLAAIEWLCLRMELLSTFVFAFCMVLLVSFPRGSIDPSMAGLAVTYGLNLNARLSRWILSFCKLENKIISIERIYQYSQIPSEAPAIIEDSRPPSSWPVNGAIEIFDLKVRYKENLPLVLHGVSCTFPGGKNIGIVGRTGSGKSTLIQALFRLIEPAGGSRFQSKNLTSFIPFSPIYNNPLKNQLPFTTKLNNKPKTTKLTVTAKRKAPIEGVSEELNDIASYNLDFAYSRRRVRSAFAEVQQQLDHCLFKDAPAGIRAEEWYERNSRGLEIFCKSWMPESGTPIKASVYFCHGYGDTCTFFFEGVARRIAASGYAVFAMDYPGFGLSEGLHGYISNFDDLVDDVIEHYTQIKARPDMRELPRVLLGQSMGGAVSLKVYLKEPDNWDAVMLVAPMCKIADDVLPPDAVMKALTLLSKVMPKAKLFPNKDLAELAFREPSKRKLAPYNVICYEDNPRLKTGMELLRVTKEIESKVEKVSAPLLILHGAADKVTDPLVSKFLYENASSKDKTLKLYENGYHCILEGEPDDRIQAVHDDIVSWLDSRCSIK